MSFPNHEPSSAASFNLGMTKTMFEPGQCLPILEAGRVRLRSLTDADIPALFGIFGEPEVTRYWGFAVLPDVAAAAVLLEQIHQGFRARTLFQWGVEATGGPLVGTCTLSQLDWTNRRAELGFALGRAFWGRGYMAAALPAVIEFTFGQLGLQRLSADVDPRNAPSIRALERLGFRREGVLREHYLVQGEPQDAIVYGLLRREWLGSAGPGGAANRSQPIHTEANRTSTAAGPGH
jgi:RimJ/RimL family protein N-acetyltransferase